MVWSRGTEIREFRPHGSLISLTMWSVYEDSRVDYGCRVRTRTRILVDINFDSSITLLVDKLFTRILVDHNLEVDFST